MIRHETLIHAVGKADACELFSRVFAFPDQALVEALHDGAVTADLRSCLTDADCRIEEQTLPARTGTSLEELRAEYTRLYLAPGAKAIIFPYESAFLHVEMGMGAYPLCFALP